MNLTLRPATDADRDFLLAVYASTRADEMAMVPWDDAAKRAFVTQQFTAQDAFYREHYDHASFDVVLRDDVPVGRLYVSRGPEEIRVMDIALLPEYRGAGIGAHLLGEICAEADATGRFVGIHVEHHNVAQRLYARLGFVPTADRGVYLYLVRPAATPQPNTAS
ncbi:MAG: GNAT family N-acetyltransferase [Gemmatirosa sp.]|nr:GNAT family N-acetyltransferase [Gemmatirosa sp.]